MGHGFLNSISSKTDEIINYQSRGGSVYRSLPVVICRLLLRESFKTQLIFSKFLLLYICNINHCIFTNKICTQTRQRLATTKTKMKTITTAERRWSIINKHGSWPHTHTHTLSATKILHLRLQKRKTKNRNKKPNSRKALQKHSSKMSGAAFGRLFI